MALCVISHGTRGEMTGANSIVAPGCQQQAQDWRRRPTSRAKAEQKIITPGLYLKRPHLKMVDGAVQIPYPMPAGIERTPCGF